MKKLTAAECARDAKQARQTPIDVLEATLDEVYALISSEAQLAQGRCEIRLRALKWFPKFNRYQSHKTMDWVVGTLQSGGFKVTPNQLNQSLFVEWMPAEEFDEKPNSVP